jgi:hypothetical protein
LEGQLIARESQLLRFMIDTHDDMMSMNMGPTGYIFPN